MREELLHFIWRFRHFNQQELLTEAGESLQILSPGEPHQDQGPDFRDARIRIGGSLREGPVELHILASDWKRHAHDGDVHYRDTILHVVWENDWRRAEEGMPGDIPMLVLQSRVSKLLLGRYDRWMKHSSFVPCERQFIGVDAGIRSAWLRQLALERLRRRSGFIRDCLQQNRQDWEETTWWLMARSMGLPVNAAAFEALARSLPLRLLARHRNRTQSLEALLLGQMGLLDGQEKRDKEHERVAAGPPAEEDVLAREYRFCRAKYGLKAISVPVSFLRMRPGHFPTVRLAQLAGLLAACTGWFAYIRDTDSPGEIVRALAGPKGLGGGMQRGILINAFIPLLFAYGQREKALQWLWEMKGEDNRIIRGWRGLGVVASNAAESQGLLELKNGYCNARRCLDCAIGRALLDLG